MVQNDRIPLSQVQDAPESTTQTPLEPATFKEAHSFMDDIEYHRMSDFFDVSYDDRKDIKIAEKLSYLTDWAKEKTKSEDRLQQTIALKELKTGLGFQSKGLELIDKLYQWTRLDVDRKRLEQKMELIVNK